MTTDAAFMAEAIRLADLGRYTTHPNPRVGCVIVKDGAIVGRGYHIQAGHGHAEVHALAEASEAARGATVYTTLEPCSFHGRTPSCAQTLVKAGVARCVSATTDPHPGNQGRGFGILREAGIEVSCGLMESSARALIPGHLSKYESGRPYIRLKLAMSLDGKTALENGESQWITGPDARRDVQRLRARSGAIVTGVQTVIDDDPAMTVRTGEIDGPHADLAPQIRRPVVVLDSAGRMPANARLRDNPDLYVATVKEAAPDAPHTVTLPRDDNGRVSLPALCDWLVAEDCLEVLVECGATLAGAFLDAGLVDELIVYCAPTVLGSDARSLLATRKLDTMAGRIGLAFEDVRLVGLDLRLTCRVTHSGT